MAAPTPTARSTPSGRFWKRGYQLLITLEADPDISFWEKEVQPSGRTIGESIDVTTQHRLVARQKAPRKLRDSTNITAVCAMTGATMQQVEAIIGKETTITTREPDGTTVAEYGYVQEFVPTSMNEENQPVGNLVIVLTNTDPSDGSEAVAAYALGTGT